MKGRRVIVTRLDTGEMFPSIRAAVEGMHVSKASLDKARKLGCKCACGIPVKFEEDMTLSGHNGGIKKPIKRMDARLTAFIPHCAESDHAKAYGSEGYRRSI